MSTVLRIEKLDLVFGPKPRVCFQALDQGLSKEEIQKATQQIVAIQNISFDVFQGEILVLMGLSGSGKSSILRCMNGLNGRGNGITRGKVLFHHPFTKSIIDIQSCRSNELRQIRRRYISMVFQQFGLMPWKNVLENVAFPLKLQGISKSIRNQIAEEKLNLVGLKDWIFRYPSELSGGMQQRVGLARAFASNAPILLMDEPFSALDPLHRKSLQDELLRLQNKLKKTMIFVTHDFNEAVLLADRIIIMESGQILQIGKAEQIINRPSCKRVQDFVTQFVSNFGLNRKLAIERIINAQEAI